MKTITTVAEMQAERERIVAPVGLVPTMGYLHEGHLSLVRRARAENDHVVVSIFVNPTQFGPDEDFERYPRDEARDLRLLEADGVDIAFVPSVEEMYPLGFDDWVEVHGALTNRLEGAHRPGHFRGVTTVVARLFRIIRPQRAYFGQKDAQQLRIIRRLVQEIHSAHPEALEGLVQIIPMPTVRESDGLALSSRNVYLSPPEREAALALPRALSLARRLVMEEGVTDADAVRSAVRTLLSPGVRLSSRRTSGGQRMPASAQSSEPSTTTQPDISLPTITLDYVSVADEQTLEELDMIDRPALVLLAARVGTTRLIDNTVVMPDN